MRFCSRALNIFTLLFFFSCTSVPSGRHILLKRGGGVKAVAKRFRVNEWSLLAHNKNKSFTKGEWVFLPRRPALSSKVRGRSPAQSSGVSKYIRSRRWLWPVPSTRRISSNYGPRWGKFHHGLDIPAKRGAKILAVSAGVVVHAGRGLGGYGRIIILSHRHGLFSIYAHNKKHFIRKGQRVHKGQVIGEVGQSGRSSGPHLHFEIRHDGESLSPLKLLARP